MGSSKYELMNIIKVEFTILLKYSAKITYITKYLKMKVEKKMSSGSEVFLTNLLSYPTLIVSILIIIVSSFLLITKGKKMNRYIQIMH